MRDIKESNTSDVTSISRRVFFKKSATIGAGFTLAMTLPGCVAFESNLNAVSGELTANAFVRISPDNAVTIIIKHIEFGQGTFTGLATIAAEEMDADWGQIVSEAAPANRKLYANLHWGTQGTGGSTAIANSYMQMREAGASARYMLVAAAAKRWSVPVDQITVSKGIVSHQSGVSASFGELAEAASNQSVPKSVFKRPQRFYFNRSG